MSEIKWSEENAQSYSNNQGSNNNQPQIGFFTLKQDKESALVRFMLTTMHDVEGISTHDIKTGGKTKKVNCLAVKDDPKSYCPLCARGLPEDKIKDRLYFKLLQYENDTNGNVTVTPKIWERGWNFGVYLNDFVKSYDAPFYNYVFKITRNGAPGSTNTQYTVVPMIGNMYSLERFPIPENAFGDFKALGRIVLKRSAQDLETYIATGELPSKSNNNGGNGSNFNAPVANNATTYAPASTVTNPQTVNTVPTTTPAQPTSASKPTAGYTTATLDADLPF